MPKSSELRSVAEVRKLFADSGQTVTLWAERHGYPRDAVYSVLSGRSRCLRGTVHQIAVDLGLKPEVSATELNRRKKAEAPGLPSIHENAVPDEKGESVMT